MNETIPDLNEYQIVCLAGGVGGAKLAEGLAQIVPAAQLTIIVNTGDDFRHLGLQICPDLDTVTYRLAGLANDETGWGRAGESWRTITEVGRLGGPDWFRLGDLDLALHLTRTARLEAGEGLTAVTGHLCRRLNIAPTVLPMCDTPAPTLIRSGERDYSFQEWFVQEKWQPPISAIHLPETARATSAVARALQNADLVLIAPSNPFVSIDPILNVYPIRELVMDMPRAVVGMSPIIGGEAVKGPAAKIMAEKGLAVSAAAVARYYGDLLDGFVYDNRDAGQVDLDIATLCTDTIMTDAASRRRTAAAMLSFAIDLAEQMAEQG